MPGTPTTQAAGIPRSLLGIPTAIKDLVTTAGIRTAFRSRVYVPGVDDDSVRLLHAAGAISLGKTVVPRFALPS